MASMAWVFFQSRRPVMSMIIIMIISPYSSDYKNTYQMLHRNVKKQDQSTVVSIPNKEKNTIFVKSNICTKRLYLKLIY